MVLLVESLDGSTGDYHSFSVRSDPPYGTRSFGALACPTLSFAKSTGLDTKEKEKEKLDRRRTVYATISGTVALRL